LVSFFLLDDPIEAVALLAVNCRVCDAMPPSRRSDV
jgi:hypothetical protein